MVFHKITSYGTGEGADPGFPTGRGTNPSGSVNQIFVKISVIQKKLPPPIVNEFGIGQLPGMFY